MNKRIAELWISELRSGKYPQTVGCLASSEGFCCLGVLCEVYQKDTGNLIEEINENGDYVYGWEDEFLPEPVAQWAEVGSEDPSACGAKLSSLNDNGMSFEEIASVIEKNIERI